MVSTNHPSPLPKYDFSRFVWQLPHADSKRSMRAGGGGEAIEDFWNRYCNGDQILFMGLYINLAVPVQEAVLIKAAKETWAWLRFHVPTIASSTESDEDDRTVIAYKLSTEDEVRDWINRTFIVTKQPRIDLDKLRYELGPEKMPSIAGDQSSLHFVSGSEAADDDVSSFGLLFRTHHTVVDGTGLKVLLNIYLRHLGSILYMPDNVIQPKLRWGTEATNLLPSIYQILVPSEPLPIPTSSSEQPAANHPYYSTLQDILEGISSGAEKAHELKARLPPPETQDGTDWPRTRRLEIRFTKEESDLIFKKLRPPQNVISGAKKGYTINHIAHAALSMVIIHDNPPTVQLNLDAVVNWNAIADGRYLLKEPYTTREAYPGYCLALSPMSIPITAYQASDGTALPLDKDALATSAQSIKRQYAKQKSTGGLLAVSAQEVDILVDQWKAMGRADNAAPPSWSPWFSADGKGEQYLDIVHNDGAGRPNLEVERFFISLNRTAPGPFFRIKSWKGIIDLSVDFNAKMVSADVVEEWLFKWKEYTLLVSRFDSGDYI